MNLATNLARSAQLHADRVAVRLGDQETTYRELDERSRRVAGLLAERGVRAGDRVGIMLPNIPEFAAVYYGVLRAGAVVVPMNPLLKAREVAYYLSDSGRRGDLHGRDVRRRGARRCGHGGRAGGRRRPDVHRDALHRNPCRRRGGPGRRGHGGDPVHLRHHRHPEGRRTHPRQPDPQRRGRRGRLCSS